MDLIVTPKLSNTKAYGVLFYQQNKGNLDTFTTCIFLYKNIKELMLMKPTKQVSVEEWEDIGIQCKKVRKEMMLLLKQSKELPKSVTDTLMKSIQVFDKYRSQAEDRMMNTGASKDVHIFYGE